MYRWVLVLIAMSALLFEHPENHKNTSLLASHQTSLTISFNTSQPAYGSNTLLSANENSREIKKKANELLKPLIEFKNAIEPHLPQKELRSLKRLAFKVLIIARRYL